MSWGSRKKGPMKGRRSQSSSHMFRNAFAELVGLGMKGLLATTERKRRKIVLRFEKRLARHQDLTTLSVAEVYKEAQRIEPRVTNKSTKGKTDSHFQTSLYFTSHFCVYIVSH